MSRYGTKARYYGIQRIVGSRAGEVEPLSTAKPAAITPEQIPILPGEFGLRDRLTHWFNHGLSAIEKQDGLCWTTLNYVALTPAAIFEKWKRRDRLIGLGFGKTTNHLAVDIDNGSEYHTEDGVREIRAALEDLGINETILIQSSHSGGWHIRAFLSEPVPTFSLACGLHQAMERAGLTIGKGTLEIFPNRKSFNKDGLGIYNRLRLPLQPDSGSYLLDDDLAAYSDSIELFLDLADLSAIANDLDTLTDYCEAAREHFYNTNKDYQSHFFKTGRLGKKGKEWKRNLEERIAQGWTARHQSNGLLGSIAEYGRVFMGLGGEALADYIHKTAIASPGYERYCDHQKEICQWSARWARSAEKYRYPYGSKKDGQFRPLGKGGPTNEERKIDAMERIVEAVEDFEASGRVWPKTIRDRRSLIAKMAHCSERTLAKSEYLLFWHPDHYHQSQDTPDNSKAVTASVLADNLSRDHTPAKTVYGSPKKNLTGPDPRRASPSSESLETSYPTSSCTTRRDSKTDLMPRNRSGTTLQPMGLRESSKIVPFLRPMNQKAKNRQIKIGDRVLSPDYRYPLVVVDLHYGDRSGEWLRAKGDDWPSCELFHISELTLLEDRNHA